MTEGGLGLADRAACRSGDGSDGRALDRAFDAPLVAWCRDQIAREVAGRSPGTPRSPWVMKQK